MSDVKLYLVRHAIAEERGDQWPDDAKRPLSAEGARRFERAARGLASLDVSIDVILASPLVRARQTAEILSRALSNHPLVTELPALAPGGRSHDVFEAIAAQGPKARLALVGHEPGIGELASKLLATHDPIPFKKGAICRIDLDILPPAPRGTLRWFLTPKILRALA